MSDPTLDRLRLARTEGVGPVTYRRLMEQFASAEEAIAALPGIARAGGRDKAPPVPSERDAARELERLHRIGGRMVFAGDPDYPPMLALLPDPPPVLSVLGDLSALHARAVGVVGARNASTNGQKLAEALATDLAASRLVVVSGMARGIDAAAHAGALHVGRTVAAVAGGLDHPYPPDHADLQARIAGRGCVVSEAPMGAAPQARHFPRRNRVIAGLSLGLVVIEAAMRSGSLITARMAIEADRELFAVPGSPLDPRCRGSNDLLRQGAHLVESAEDVLANLPENPRRVGLARLPAFAGVDASSKDGGPAECESSAPSEDGLQERIFAMLSPGPTEVDDLIRGLRQPAAAVGAALVQLELAMRIEFIPGNRVVRLS